ETIGGGVGQQDQCDARGRCCAWDGETNMNEIVVNRRAGGRSARVAARSAPLAENLRPVRPGMPGGQYKPLTEAAVKRIHEAALDALEVIGLSQAPQTGVDYMTKAGAILGEDG